MNENDQLSYMQRALQLAEQGRLTVSPNPMVGCVIVLEGEVVGEGYHIEAGGPHAEIFALQQAGDKATNSTVFLTLEPCSHHGRTPPCVEALIRAQVKTVIIATLDDNPIVHGNGVAALRTAGIEVQVGLCEQEACDLNKIFSHYIRHQQPYVISKWAMSLDGRTVTQADDSRQISSVQSCERVHQMRRSVDAILIGANTLRVDNPALTARCITTNVPYAKQPIRLILTNSGCLPVHATLFKREHPGKTIIVTTAKTQISNLPDIEVMIVDEDEQGKVDLHSLMRKLGKREITSVLVEGGMQVHQQFMQQNLINQYQVYISNKLIGNLPKKMTLSALSCTGIGNDFLLTAEQRGGVKCSVES